MCIAVDAAKAAHQIARLGVEHYVSGLDDEVRVFIGCDEERLLRLKLSLANKRHTKRRFVDRERGKERVRIRLDDRELRDARPIQTDERIRLREIQYAILPPAHLTPNPVVVNTSWRRHR
jgi:hypothetical protein